MNKKKILVLAMTLSMVAILAIGGTIAYFTDTDSKTNTFTSGKVDITLVEDFGDNDPETPEKLMPGKQNAVKKEVTIELEEGSEPSYVWYTWKIPTYLDSTDGSTGLNNIVHVNSYGRTWDAYRENNAYWIEGQTEALPLEMTWDHDPDVELSALIGPEGYIGTETIDGIVYNVYVVLYHGVLEEGESTTAAMSQVYLDQEVDFVDDRYVKGDWSAPAFLMENFNIIVDAYAIQATGIADVYAAYTAYQAQ